jgi:radical SAM-linked protein
MGKLRLRFVKEGRAKYISHLDFMHTVQRAFFRADIGIRHTEGFNPHPYLSFALPLPVGMESDCELLDFELAGDMSPEEIPALLNDALPEGIRATGIYEPVRKAKEIAFLQIRGSFLYDGGVPAGCAEKILSLFQSGSVPIIKKTKRGEKELDLIP